MRDVPFSIRTCEASLASDQQDGSRLEPIKHPFGPTVLPMSSAP